MVHARSVIKAKDLQGSVENRIINVVEHSPSEDEADDGKRPKLNAPLLQPEGHAFGGKEAEYAVAIEWREGQQVESAQQDVQREVHTEDRGDSIRDAAGLCRHYAGPRGGIEDKDARQESHFHGDAGQ